MTETPEIGPLANATAVGGITIRQRRPTAAQEVFDALAAKSHLTVSELQDAIGYDRALDGLQYLRDAGIVRCRKGKPCYSLIPEAVRPIDRRGRKRPAAA